MSATLPLLRRDHVNFVRLLETFERQLDAAENGGPYSIELTKMILTYFRGYPRKVHHPKEDLIYSALVLEMPDNASNVFHVIQDHRELAERLEAVEQSLSHLDPVSEASVGIFCHQARRFIEKERQHIALEEGHLYPSAARRLTPKEWAGIDRFMADEMDPLFGDAVAGPYEKLKNAILALDETIRTLQ